MLIGLTGQLGVGKDTVYERAAVLSEARGLPAPVRISFADKLKEAAAAALGVHRDVLEAYKRDERARVILRVPTKITSDSAEIIWEEGYVQNALTIREYLQRFGTEVGRDTFGENFWVDQALPLGSYSLTEGRDAYADKNYFVTDVRFENEAQRVLDLGGIIIRVMNGPLLEPEHASENILDSKYITSEIDNSVRDDSYLHLDEQVGKLL